MTILNADEVLFDLYWPRCGEIRSEFQVLLPDGQFIRFVGAIPEPKGWELRDGGVDVDVAIVEIIERGSIYAAQGAD